MKKRLTIIGLPLLIGILLLTGLPEVIHIRNAIIPGKFVFVRGGTFTMGRNEKTGNSGHGVTVGDFYIGKYEVTQKEWFEIMGTNPSIVKGDNLPVEGVCWYETIVFCNKKSIKEKLIPCYRINGGVNPDDWGPTPEKSDGIWDSVSCNFSAGGYRLPTEAEWEFAARGGNKCKSYRYSGSNDINVVGWYWENSGDTYQSGEWNWNKINAIHCRIRTIGTKKANNLGIYDMSGNVNEWCWDQYKDVIYTSTSDTSSFLNRVFRGGGYSDEDYACGITYRYGYHPCGRFNGAGLRIVRSAAKGNPHG